MKKDIPKNRTDHFLQGFPDLPVHVHEKIWDCVHRSKFGAEDPTAILIAMNVITEHALKTQSAELRKLATEHERVVERAQKRAVTEIETKGYSFLNFNLSRIERHSLLRVAVQLSFAFFILAGASILFGFLLGRAHTAGLDLAFIELSTRPDAKAWLDLIGANWFINLDEAIRLTCAPDSEYYMLQQNGVPACQIPFWLANEGLPQIASVAASNSIWEHLKSLIIQRESLTFLIVGLVTGVSLTFLYTKIDR